MRALLRKHIPLLLALLLGLALRAALWGRLPRTGLIGDEAEYLAAADWLAHGRGFAWHTQYLWTRAPLYPLFLAGHIALFGRSLAPIFVSQSLLSLLNIGLVYGLARQVAGPWPRAAAIAALLAAIYLPFASYAQLLLSETLFTSLLLGALLALGRWAGGRRAGWLAAGGALLGLAALTRGLTLGFVPIVAVWVALNAKLKMQNAKGWLREAATSFCILTFACCIILLPWTYYASRAYGGLVLVDTTGAFNLALGARTAYDGGRSDAPLRGFVLALLDPRLSAEARRALLADPQGGACLYAAGDARLLAALARPAAAISQAERQSLLNGEALCLLRAAPGAFVRKSLGELIDLFQINYTGDERLSRGFALGRLPPWYALALFALDDTLYVLALPLAVLGWALLRRRDAGAGPPALAAPPPLRPIGGAPYRFGQPAQAQQALRPRSGAHTLLGLWLLYNLGTAPLLFAINRFRVPLMPLAFVLAGCALAALPAWGGLRSRYGAACAALAGLLWLVAATPYAYLEPRAPGAAAGWASYFGPYPSSLASTGLALAARPGYLAEQALAEALGAGNAPAARAALESPALPAYAAAVGAPLLDGLEGRPAAGLNRLAGATSRPLEQWQTALVAGELFRQLGDIDAARRELNPALVDNENPVEWAWQWLHPPPAPAGRIDLADDNDLGYIRGFYLGRFDADLRATLRWAGGDSALRFPAAASGAPQRLCLRLAGLGWPPDMALPELAVALGQTRLGAISLTRELREQCLDLPARPAGADLIITLRSATFVPDALDLLGQQGPQVGQLRQLAYQLDWAEVR